MTFCSTDSGNDVEQRVTRLETHFEYIRADLDEIKAEQRWLARQVEAKFDAINTLLTDIRVELAKRRTTGQVLGHDRDRGGHRSGDGGDHHHGHYGGLAWLGAAP